MVKREFTIGSKRETAKEININLTKKHLYYVLGLSLVITGLFYFGVFDTGQTFNHFVGCGDGTKEAFIINQTNYCGVEMTEEMYNTFVEATK